MKASQPKPCDRNAAFTLRELLVVISVVTLLAGLVVITARGTATRRNKVAQCAANLRQFALATHLYASENRDRLPEIQGGTWAWDMPTTTTSALLQYDMARRTFYCPGTSPRFDDKVNFLNPYPNSLWTFGQPVGFRVIGYLFAFSGPAFTMSLTNQNTTIASERTRVSFTVIGGSTYLDSIPANSERVLLADATLSENQAGTPANPAPAGSFANVQGGFMFGSLPHLSPHLKGALPAGGNLAFKDGHVQWRPFAEMALRASGQSRGFWW